MWSIVTSDEVKGSVEVANSDLGLRLESGLKLSAKDRALGPIAPPEKALLPTPQPEDLNLCQRCSPK